MSAAKPPLKNLPDDPEQLKAIILQLSTRVSALEEYIRLEQLRKFASKSEKAPASQYEMFNEAELCEAAEAALVETEAAETASPTKRTSKPGRKPLPADLPRVRIEHDLADEEWSRGEPLPSRLLKNYLRGLCGVKNGLKMLIYSSKLRFFGHFCLA